MKSIKKRFKAVLTDIQQIAAELLLLSDGIDHLQDMPTFAEKVGMSCKELKQQASQLSKIDFAAGLTSTLALQALEDASDKDLISIIEERYFAQTEQNADHILFQQLLAKLEQRYALLLKKIQHLQTVLEEGASNQ